MTNCTHYQDEISDTIADVHEAYIYLLLLFPNNCLDKLPDVLMYPERVIKTPLAKKLFRAHKVGKAAFSFKNESDEANWNEVSWINIAVYLSPKDIYRTRDWNLSLILSRLC